jgi:hypothetical protein
MNEDTQTINLSVADVEELLKFVKEAGVQHFTVHKTNCAGIGYTLEVEYPQTQFGKSGTFKAELVGVDQW